MSEGQQPIFYQINSAAFSFREYFWGTKNPLIFVIAAIIKLLRINLGGSIDDPAVSELTPFEVSEEQIPPDVRAKFEPLRAELIRLGFVEPIFHSIQDKLNFTQIYWATFRHTSGDAFARIHCRIWSKTHPHKFHLFPNFFSIFSDGTGLFSSSGKPDTELPPSITTLRLQGRPTAEVWEKHQTELHRANKPAYGFTDAPTLRWGMETFHAMARDFHLKRKAFAPLNAHEAKRAEIIRETQATAAERGLANADVLAEIELLQKAPTNWTNSIWLLVITGIAFFATKGGQGSWKGALWIIPILLFHELGHYLAMYVFKYRNLRMFFIPFLGAAVTGQNYNVAAWKKVVVSLMGPVPGIALGVALAIAGAMRGNETVINVASLLIIVNGFNLLPLLPLDGGHVVGDIIFARHYLLDTVFRGLTALGIIILSFALGTKALMYFGIVSLIALGTSFKLARITERIKARSLPTFAEGQSIPIETADAIATEVKNEFKKNVNSKQIAEHTLTVFQTLNTRPPNWAASLFFLAVHGAAVLVAIVVGSLVFVHKIGGLDVATNIAELQPVMLDNTTVRAQINEGAKALARSNSVAIVATFKKSEDAARNYSESLKLAPAESASLLFGNTVYIRFAATNAEARTALFNRLSAATTNTFVERSNYLASFTFVFGVTNAATNAPWLRHLEEYWDNAYHAELIPPWTPKALVDSAAESDYLRARHTLHLLTHTPQDKTVKITSEDDTKALFAALRSGDTARVDALNNAMKKRREAAQKARFDKVRALPLTEVHASVIDNYMDYPSDTNAIPKYRAAQNKLRELMGEWKKLDASVAKFGVRGGYMDRNKTGTWIYGVSFEDLTVGGPQFVRWMNQNGVTHLRYSISTWNQTFRGGDDETDDDSDELGL